MKLMIVEDELLCRENLLSVPWDTVGITSVDSAESATDAIEKIKESSPDIIITDIEMSGGDGFQLAEEVSFILPECKIIFLTAYNKFEYAQQAIRYKAFAFILKPLNRKKLLQTVQEAKAEIESSTTNQEKYKKLLTDFSNCKYFLKDYFFSALTQDNKQQLADLFPNVTRDSHFQAVVVAGFDENGESAPLSFKFFSDILAVLEQYSYNVIPFFDQSMLSYIFVWNNDETKTVFENTLEAAEVIKKYLKYHNATNGFTVAIGSVADGMSTINYSHIRATEALKYRFSLGKKEIIYIDDIEPRDNSIIEIDSLKTQLIDSIKIGNIPLADKAIHKIFANMQDSYTSIDLAQRVCFEIFIMISIAMAQLGQNPEVLFNKSEIWSVLKNYHSLSSLKNLLMNISELAVSLINTTRDEKDTDIINQVKKLVEAHPDTDISLNEMARKVYISPCYLSSMFKNKAGISYKNYIINIKIEKAKELLTTTDLPIYEIATAVGYKSNQHFSHLFQAQTGLLPTEYRNQHRE